jgi:hypothetical protein
VIGEMPLYIPRKIKYLIEFRLNMTGRGISNLYDKFFMCMGNVSLAILSHSVRELPL